MNRTLTLLDHWAQLNLGHLIWEDIGNIWVALSMFNAQQKPFTIANMGFKCDQSCRSAMDDILVGLEGMYGGSLHETFQLELRTQKQRDITHVCFDLVGGGFSSVFQALPPFEDRLSGKESTLLAFRNKILDYYKLQVELPREHHIILTNKSQSVWKNAGAQLHRGIFNLIEIKAYLSKIYPDIRLSVVEWHKLSFRQNLALLSTATILITPCGGVSTLLPFLPPGAHAIVMGKSQCHLRRLY